ncbi:hypothetical protein RFM68_17950 [Mesorhizobium sp. MSK_1335]|uniref:Uncharacterized protein n=2 Tax=Mesorhizobium montanum TaxID=3072323 RepID=A0ABU4ZM04_9HYPH|nr:hypothetical protein [Mesorhizobium sp. MSK_1335]
MFKSLNRGARALGLEGCGIAGGGNADFVALGAEHVPEAVVSSSARSTTSSKQFQEKRVAAFDAGLLLDSQCAHAARFRAGWGHCHEEGILKADARPQRPALGADRAAGRIGFPGAGIKRGPLFGGRESTRQAISPSV